MASNGRPIGGWVEVPDNLAPFLYNQFNLRGLMMASARVGTAEFKKAHREALIKYLGIYLRERIVNFMAFEDEMRRKGARIIPDPRFERALRWEKELRELLNKDAPIEEELSFYESKRVEGSTIPEGALSLQDGEVEVVQESFLEEPVKPVKRGRPKVDEVRVVSVDGVPANG